MSETLQWVQFSSSPSSTGGDSNIGAPPPPRLKPILDVVIPPQFGGDKVEVTAYTPPATLNLVQNSASDNTISKNSSSTTSSTNNNNNSTSNGSPLSPTNGVAPPQFPTQPCLLANKYLITRSIDSNTSEAIHLPTHTVLLVKCLPSQNAREVCAQHALLGDQEGIRPPLELIQGSEGRSWLVIAPHYGDLHSYVRTRRRIREGEAQRLFSQVTRVVELCHGAGLVLRDLKLRKIVFTDANRRRVSLESLEDSVVSGGEDTLEDKHGCPAYVAPEILRAAAYSGRAADMWSLGVMLYTMLIGRYPFHGCDTNALFLKIRSGEFIVPDWVSSRARHLIQLLLQREPSSRPTASKVLAHPWLTRPPRDLPPKDIHDHIVPEMLSTRQQSSAMRNKQSYFFGN
uniref:Tribbles homolog 2-like n=1 Tax=Hirondellea gigas TaxID=1518452 RepID=A0A2P2I0D9_9CRUS